MIVLVLIAVFALYFLYLTKWAQSVLSSEYNFASPSPPKPLPHSPSLSIVVATLWGILLLAGSFWGFTFNRYPAHLSIRDADVEIYLLIALCAAIGLSHGVIYRLGEMKGVEHMKSTALFQTWLEEFHRTREAPNSAAAGDGGGREPASTGARRP